MSAEQPIVSNADRRLLFRADAVFRRLDDSLAATERTWLDDVPLARTVEAFDAEPPGSPMRVVIPEIRAIVAVLDGQGGKVWVDRHMRMALALLLVRTLTRQVPYRLPPSVDAALAAERVRILEDLEETEPEHYALGGPLVRDRSFCQGTALPFDIFSGRLFGSVSSPLLAKAGFPAMRESPWLNLHLDLRPEFPKYSDTARIRGTVLMVDFLRVNPAYQGIMGVSWFTDPQVVDISPHFRPLLDDLLEAGAAIVSLEARGGATVQHATATSRTRRRLYEEGKYTPNDTLMLCPSDGLIAFIDRRTSRTTEEP